MERLFLIIISGLLLFPLEKKGIMAADSEKIYYRVKSGDSLDRIAARFGVNPSSLREWNKISNPNKLRKNDRLVIYKSDPGKITGLSTGSGRLKPGEGIHLSPPAERWEVIQGFRNYGDSVNPGLLCRLSGRNIIKPANNGVIVRISQMRGYGRYILIDHGNGWHSMYSNLEQIQVKLGQRVSLADTIGNARDNKLFFLLAYNGKPVNPSGYFKR